ncbi:MAG: immunoglobulin-like domain-containing protein [Pyrinomonadaceae bacterium]
MNSKNALKSVVSRRHNAHRIGLSSRASSIALGAVVVLGTLIATSFYAASSASTAKNKQRSVAASTRKQISKAPMKKSAYPLPAMNEALKPLHSLAPDNPPAIATYASDCTTAQTQFAVGDIVCVQVSGFPVGGFFPRKLTWATTDSTIVQSTDITADPQSDSRQITATTLVNGLTVDNRGTWQIAVRNPFFFFPEALATFTISDPQNTAADLAIASTFSEGSIQTGSEATFGFQVNNYGPDSSANVTLSDALPNGASLVSFQQLTGPTFNCSTTAGSTSCSIASLSSGATATFEVKFTANSVGELVNTATISAATTDVYVSNNSTSATAEITANTGSACTLSCPSSIVANNDAGTAGHIIHSADFPAPTTTGTCGSVSLSVTPNPQTQDYFFPIGTSFVTASTESGETCTFTVTVSDTEAPSITCPSDVTTFESSPGSGSKNVVFDVNATDNSGSATVSCDHPSGSSFAIGTTQVTCTASDSSDNSSPSCSFNVIVNTVTSTCVLTTQAPIVTNSDASACGTHVNYTTPTSDGTGSCGTIACDHASGSFFPVGETLVTCTSQPDGGSTTFTVTVNDTTAPVPDLASLPTITKDCTANAGVPVIVGGHTVFEPPTATDNCGGSIQGSTNDPRVYTDPGTFTVHWTYIDASGNNSEQDQTIVVTGADTTPPVPDVATLPMVTDECSATVTTGPTATDDCDGTITGTTSDPLTYTGVGTYTVHWTYMDQAGHSVQQNQTVVVTDVHTPTISLTGASSITVECHTSFADPGVTTTDNCVPKNVTVNTTGAVNVDAPGTYTLTYTATDGGGNQASVDRTVIVQDTTKPIVALNGAASITVECHTSFTDPGATASDTCDTSVPVSVSGSVDINVPGTYTLTYNGTDDSGNMAIPVQRTVIVVDTTAPSISCPGSIVLQPTCPSGAVATYVIPTGSDTCSASVTITRTAGLASGSVFPIGTTTVTYSATDASNNSRSCSFTVTVNTPQTVIGDMMNTINGLSLSGTQKQGLNSKLQAALDAINQGKTNVACNKLGDFISQVSGYINNGTLSSAVGQPLIDSAKHIQNTIGCTNLGCS